MMPPSPLHACLPGSNRRTISGRRSLWEKKAELTRTVKAVERTPAVRIGFVEAACDKLARRANRFGRNRAAKMSITVPRHCEERSDEAIQALLRRKKAGLLRFARNDGAAFFDN